ncbi:alpha-L-rhamnosidase N-terminal domain-containing protein [Spirosoma sp.]|uniref:alpha-L-rhamnosidase N-terminal domain-containing protein n=1 Tax=Spirosoma sp. TaxID=1899569 RepID=UPI00261BF831|nr:alpha-L-rhamnosidase N-terminal domain-containing protein [Spirosoma sp.]MCX6216235.1 alpha-L-rhamnosidase N-terminal domain-containing protein [Spirosoma sp.]
MSADNRYKLFVNGKQVGQGPTRGDLYFWNFETLDLAPYLQAGQNTVAAVVWNDGRAKPEAQISYLTAFILQGNTEGEEVLNTNDSWKTVKDTSYQPLPVRVPGYYVAGPSELVDMTKQVKGWEKTAYDDSRWASARQIGPGLTKDAAVNASGWMLVPSPLPPMEMTGQRLASTSQAVGVQVPAGFPASKVNVTIPANTKATILLDQGYLTNAYPTLVFSGGQRATVSMGYAEAHRHGSTLALDGWERWPKETGMRSTTKCLSVKRIACCRMARPVKYIHRSGGAHTAIYGLQSTQKRSHWLLKTCMERLPAILFQ